MKKLYILLAIIFTTTATFSQPCLPEGITFSTQQQIDDFPNDFPNCTEIEGDAESRASDEDEDEARTLIDTLISNTKLYNSAERQMKLLQ